MKPVLAAFTAGVKNGEYDNNAPQIQRQAYKKGRELSSNVYRMYSGGGQQRKHHLYIDDNPVEQDKCTSLCGHVETGRTNAGDLNRENFFEFKGFRINGLQKRGKWCQACKQELIMQIKNVESTLQETLKQRYQGSTDQLPGV